LKDGKTGVTAGGYAGFAGAGTAHVSLTASGTSHRLTWLEEGLLGLIVAEDPGIVVLRHQVVCAMGGLRNGQQAGPAPRPPID
jgi:hypothetical protein